MKLVIIYLLVILTGQIIGQEISSFEIEISDDTVLIGNYFEIKYEALNLNGEFDLPDFDHFEIVSGPNQGRNISITNGEQTSIQTISFLLKPSVIGVASLPPAYFVAKEKTWEVGPRDITVLSNPEGIVTDSRLSSDSQSFNFFEQWNQQNTPRFKRKKKLKETKI